MEEKRREPRTSVSFPVACSIIPRRKYFYTVCRDISGGGARIISNDFIPRGNLLKVNINFIDKAMDLTAQIRWCNKQRYSDRYYAGVQFTGIDNNDKNYISKLVTSTTH